MVAFALALIFLIPASLACLHYLALVAAGLFPRRTPLPAEPTHRIAVLIPAHDEEAALPETLRSLDRADYPLHLLRCLVVADNCTDRTAEIARRGGADCIERRDPERRGKGYAVQFGLEDALAGDPDAVLILDADCGVDPGLLLRFDAELAAGATAVQAAVRSANTGAGGAGYAAAVGADMDNLMAAGAARLGGAVPLRGTGMLFRADLLRRYPWRVSGPTEDAEYREVLRRAGVPIRFAADRAVLCLPPPGTEALLVQRRRWRSALSVPGRNAFSRMLGSKPLVLGHLALTTAAVAALAPGTATGIWLLALYAATVAAYLPSILRVGRPAGGAAELLRSVGLVARLALVALAGFRRRERTWRRTPREPLDSAASSDAIPATAPPAAEARPGGARSRRGRDAVSYGGGSDASGRRRGCESAR